MAKHIKGHLLETLANNGQMWDYELAEEVMSAFDLDGEYWWGTVRLTLTDLYSGGLISECGTDLDPSKSRGVEKVLFKFELTRFGHTRMAQAGLG